MLDLERVGEDTVAGRFFVKKDLQGADGRHAHPGVLSAALQEAMRLAAGASAEGAPVQRLEVDFTGEAPVGTFVGIEAQVERHDGRGPRARAEAFDPADRRTLARAAARFPSTGGGDA